MLKIHNSLTKEKALFEPIHGKKVGIYVCGMTVYDYCHIGHGRIFVVFDMITRYLRSCGYEVTYVRNITDIDDKIINRANELGEDFNALTDKFIAYMHEDERALGVLAPDHEPRATEFIPQIVAMITTLVENKNAYVAENGDVYFDVSSFDDYGLLAHQDLDQLQAGSRVDVLDVKHQPLDFVLWKQAKPDEPKWPSPWGDGRPGWHIECSAMSNHILGNHFDIHGGGLDLVFPHHQNEIAQSEGANGCQFVNFWMHAGHVQVNREKMSKSLGNFFTIREVLSKYHPEVVRYFMLASHYRSPINYSTDNLDSARHALERFYIALRGLEDVAEVDDNGYEEAFGKAMDDDFNTPDAFAVLFDLTRDINRLRDQQEMQKAAGKAALLKKLANIIGILTQQPEAFLLGDTQAIDEEKVNALIEQRMQARNKKDWSEADRLRDHLLDLGIVLEDKPNETLWRRGER